MNKAAGILGIGSYVPDKVLSNADLEKMVDTSDEWILKRTGISERRILDKDKPAYSMGIIAANRAIVDAGIDPKDIGMVLVTTSTPDYICPSMACVIQDAIGAVNAAAFDMNAACAAFAYAITTAEQFIKTGYYKYVLIIGCEALSKYTDYTDRNTCILFGDGAGAIVMGPVEEGYGVLNTHLGSDGSYKDVITIPCFYLEEKDLEVRPNENKQVIWMDGSEVFKFATKILSQATYKVLEMSNMKVEDIDWLIPHQANIRIIDNAVKKLGIDANKVCVNVDRFGNMASASILIALDEAVKANKIHKGNNLMMVGFGGGVTWGATLIKWSK